MLRRVVVTLLVAFFASAGPVLAVPPEPTKQAVAIGTGGSAASVDALATQAAIRVLDHGGNAVDAAVAAAAVLGVVEPYSCGLGGGGFMLIYSGASGRVYTLDGRETAPLAFRPEGFINPATGTPISFAEGVTSGLGVGVPGTLLLWDTALRRFGTYSLARALAPAIPIAARGFVVDQTFADQTASNLNRFKDFTSTRAVFLTSGGGVPPVGSRFQNPLLAETYSLIADDGVDAFYRGPIASAIVNTVQHPPLVAGATRNVRPGLMVLGDLDRYVVVDRPPTHIGYRGLDI
jgi:gamma-glutamyltranspeptidase / glutathione hydrolase